MNWINVENELPDFDELVLITFWNKDVGAKGLAVGKLVNDPDYGICFEEGDHYWEVGAIAYWCKIEGTLN